MAELQNIPVAHDHAAFLARARSRKGFAEAYDALVPKYEVIAQLLRARTKAGLTQAVVDPRYNRVVKGRSPRIDGLAGTWASDPQYAAKIRTKLRELYARHVPS